MGIVFDADIVAYREQEEVKLSQHEREVLNALEEANQPENQHVTE